MTPEEMVAGRELVTKTSAMLPEERRLNRNIERVNVLSAGSTRQRKTGREKKALVLFTPPDGRRCARLGVQERTARLDTVSSGLSGEAEGEGYCGVAGIVNT